MDQLLLTTKLSPPVIRGNLVHRPRLVDRLRAGLLEEKGFARKLTLISAPAGYGKSSLAADGLAGIPYPVTWLSLDEADNDPARFLAYLLAALQQVEPSLGRAGRPRRESPQPPPAEMVLTALLNDLAGFGSPLILVLDDYHTIHSQPIHAQVAFLLERQPANLHVIILTREDPLLPISLLLSRDQASQLRQEDLRFTPGETSEFLSQTMGLELGVAEIEQLQQRTEGWIAGLQLAALSLQGQPDQRGLISALSGSSRFILDYLFEQVFERQPSAIQDFLLKTSVLERLSGDLCDQVAGRSQSAALLESLERSNLFISRLDAGREWYRYHHLFQELLRHRLHFGGQDKISPLHQLASQWYEAHGLLVDAIDHALEAEDWNLAGRLVEQVAGDLLKRGEIVTLLGWFQRFPPEVVRADPGLCFSFAWPLILAGQLETAELLLSIAEAAAQHDPPFLLGVLTAQSNLERTRGNFPRTIELSQRALRGLPDSDLMSHSLLAVNLGIAYWHVGQNDAAEKALLEARRAAQACGNTFALLAATIFLGRVHAVRGELHSAAEIYRSAVQKGGQIPILAIAQLDLAALHYEWNELEACRERLQDALSLNRYGGNAEVDVATYLMMARLECACEDLSGMDAAFTKIDELESRAQIPEAARRRVPSCRLELALARGDVDGAALLLEQAAPDLGVHPFYRFLRLNAARLAIARGQKEEAAHLLAGSFAQAEEAGWGYGALAVRVLQALAAERQDDALGFLTDALQRSHSEGYLRLYTDAGQALIPLLLEAARCGIYPEDVGRILGSMQKKPGPAAAAERAVQQVEPLSERELEVLRLLAAGLSNREIAAQLYVSLGTVKTHVHHICGKMGVANRTQAVVHARDFGII